MIRPVQVSDAPAIARIYQPYVTNTTISFETEPPSVDEIAARIQKIIMGHSWLVYESEGTVQGTLTPAPFANGAHINQPWHR
jgi:L-amino acid N-acyltransferase YncA